MEKNNHFTFKIATEPFEFEQIYQLNYETFVEEIPQHAKNEDQKLVDKFHDQNLYFICLKGQEVIGMLCYRDKRPFSLDSKVSNLDELIPKMDKICELRLLSVKKEYRNGRVFYGIVQKLCEFVFEQDYELALISGTIRQLKLYKHLGFQEFAPPVGTSEALYYPMYQTVEHFKLRYREAFKV
jgi:predicted N-acetyltransferase YhbS